MKLGPVYWIIGSALCGVGLITAVAGYALGASAVSGETFTKTFDEADSIDLELNNCSLDITVSDKVENFTVSFDNVCNNPETHVTEGTLFVSNKDNSKKRLVSFGNIGSEGTVTLTIPAKSYDSVKIDLDAAQGGKVSNLVTDSLSIDIDAGKLTFSNVDASKNKTIIDLDAASVDLIGCSFMDTKLDLDAGKCHINDTIFGGHAEFDVDAATVELTDCSLDSSKVEVDAGTVNLKGAKLNGNMDCEASASSMNIGILGDKSNFSVLSNNDASTIKVDGTKGSMFNKGAENLINIDGSASKVIVTFDNRD